MAFKEQCDSAPDAADLAADPSLPPAARSRPAQSFSQLATNNLFTVQVCRDCGQAHYPAREVCSSCLSTKLVWVNQHGGGTLVAATIVRRPYEPYFRALPEKRIGLVRLDCGVTVVAFLHADCATPRSRVNVEPHLDRAGHALLVALPEDNSEALTDDPRLGDLTRIERP